MWHWQRRIRDVILRPIMFFCIVLCQQQALADEATLSIQGRIHLNINTNAYDASREFYRQLGFGKAIGPFPETNTLEMAHSMGMSKPYRMYAEIIYLGESDIEPTRLHEPTGRMIDLIQWFEPENLQPAYGKLNALGFIKVVLGSDDLNADLRRMAALGYEPIGPVATASNGAQFAVLKDPAGTFVELRQNKPGTRALTNGSYVTHIDHLNINVSELQRSVSFYQRLGFESAPISQRVSDEKEALARGFSEPFSVREAMLTHAADGSRILLSQWMSPADSSQPHPLPINHAGIQRVNYASADIENDVAELERAGVQFVSPIVRCCDGDRSTMGIAVFEDPDGVFLQLLGAVDPLVSD